jgi:DNA processing protein
MIAENNQRLNFAERVAWLRLFRSENVGPATFFRLVGRYRTASAALDMLPELARRGGRRQRFAVHSRSAAEHELEELDRLGGAMIACVEPEFPPALRSLETAPLITVRGNPALLTRAAVAVVGARNASVLGRRMARMLAAGLGESGLLVVSGMARGIDAAAHEGSLASGTLAVLAGGVDVVYPQENRSLYERICATGCVIAEMAPGTQPQTSHFPRRNRLISGIALGVVVVEATARSGSLITARFALDQGREVFAVPGSPLDPRSQGPNSLIKQGATLAESAADVLDVLGQMTPHAPLAVTKPALDDTSPDDGDMAAARKMIVPALAPAPVTVDEIVRQCQLSPAVVSMVLVELELAGRLQRHPGNQVSLLP